MKKIVRKRRPNGASAKLEDSTTYPFAWQRRFLRKPSGRPNNSTATQYGKAEILSVRMPPGIKRILSEIARDTGKTVSILVFEFCERGIAADSEYSCQLEWEKRAPRHRDGSVGTFDWSAVDTPLLEEMKSKEVGDNQEREANGEQGIDAEGMGSKGPKCTE
jgi:predicted DNA-binding protein